MSEIWHQNSTCLGWNFHCWMICLPRVVLGDKPTSILDDVFLYIHKQRPLHGGLSRWLVENTTEFCRIVRAKQTGVFDGCPYWFAFVACKIREALWSWNHSIYALEIFLQVAPTPIPQKNIWGRVYKMNVCTLHIQTPGIRRYSNP